MNPRYRMYRRSQTGRYYVKDARTGRAHSLKTRDKTEASRRVAAMNESVLLPEVNRQIGVAYIAASDPSMAERTWQDVFDEFCKHGKAITRERKLRGLKSKPFDLIRRQKVIETTSADFLRVLERGGTSTNMFLRKVHNFALELDWLPKRILSRRVWPKVVHHKKRAITREEHEAIIKREPNDERRLYYELLWETGASQTDAANLTVACVHWREGVVVIHRRKIERHEPVPARVVIGQRLASILRQLPTEGDLFPYLRTVRCGDRATEFAQRCRGLGIQGITLHCYRYAWAQRAMACGYPERFAMSNLGHGSKAVHRAYAGGADMTIPSLESYEQQAEEPDNIVPFPIQVVGK